MEEINRTAITALESIIRQRLGLLGGKDLPPEVNDAAALSLGGDAKILGGAKQLASIFDQISLSAERENRDRHFLPLKALALDARVIFPGVPLDSGTMNIDYEALAKNLQQSLQVNEKDLDTRLANLLESLMKYGWCIPAATLDGVADISLYDHARMTAALSVCLHQGGGQEDQPTALLVGGDISGIQSFIYTISSKKAAKTLRGRSFYLQLLTEAVLRYVLKQLELPYSNVIYSGGGHFFLLAPPGKQNAIEKVQEYITKTLLAHHGSSLYFALGWAEVPKEGFELGKFPSYWSEMHRSLAVRKQRRYSELGDDMYQALYEPTPHGGNQEKTCSVCGVEREDVSADEDYPEDTGSRICKLCESFSEPLGRRLAKEKLVGLGFGKELQTSPGKYQAALNAFGMYVEWPNDRNEISFSRGVQRAVAWKLDDVEIKHVVTSNVPMAISTRYTVNLLPLGREEDVSEINNKLPNSKIDDLAKVGVPLTFSHIQTFSDGIQRLGVLRADVDSLGEIFKRGFGEGENSKATLVRLATLSFQMSLFFEGWVEQICQEKFENKIYAVYAGGDDIFLIGPWNIMPQLGFKIVEDFKLYTGENPDMHLSGGIAIIGGKYPVYQAADDAEEELDRAKSLSGKNGLCFLDQAWKWDVFKDVSDKHHHLMGLAENRQVRPVLHRLMDLTQKEAEHSVEMKRKAFEIKNLEKRQKLLTRPFYGPWIWLGVYYLKRQEGRVKDEEAKQNLTNIREELNNNNFENIAHWGTAARWTELEIRKSNHD